MADNNKSSNPLNHFNNVSRARRNEFIGSVKNISDYNSSVEKGEGKKPGLSAELIITGSRAFADKKIAKNPGLGKLFSK